MFKFFTFVLLKSETSVQRLNTTNTHTAKLTIEFSGDSDFPLLAINLGVDGDSIVVSHPEGLDHPLFQSLCHIFLGHVEDPQVWKANKKKSRAVTVRPDQAAEFGPRGVPQT